MKIKALEARISKTDTELSQENSLIHVYEEKSKSGPNLEAKLVEAMEKLEKQVSLIKSLQEKKRNEHRTVTEEQSYTCL
jgi:hypothetical protein